MLTWFILVDNFSTKSKYDVHYLLISVEFLHFEIFSFSSQCPDYSMEEPSAMNDSLNASLINGGFAIPQHPLNTYSQPIIQLHSTPECLLRKEKSVGAEMVCTESLIYNQFYKI